MIRDRALEAEAAKPAIRQIEVHFFTQPSLRIHAVSTAAKAG